MADGFAYQPPYTLTPGQPPPGTATLLRLSIGLPTAGSVRNQDQPEGFTRKLSITRFSMDDSVRVREYQPVVHRLRLSASP